MASLTPQQRQFVERYILGRPLTEDRLDLADGPPAGRAAGLAGDAANIRQSLAQLAMPPGVNAAERAAMIALINRINQGLAEPLVAAMVAAAGRDVLDLERLHQAHETRLTTEAAARRARGEELRDAVGKATVKNADPDAATAIQALATKVTAGWSDPPSATQIAKAEVDLAALQDAVEKEKVARDARQQSRADLLQKVTDLKAEGADEAENLLIGTAKTGVSDALPDFPGVKALADAEGLFSDLEALVSKTRDAVAARALRRDEIVAAKGAEKPAGLIKAERDRIDGAVAGFPVLDGAISAADLALAETALEKLRLLREELGPVGSARALAAARVVQAVKAAVWGAGDLTVPAGAPAALTDPLRIRVEALHSDNAAYAKADAPDGWAVTDPVALGQHADEVVKAIAAIAKGLTDIGGAVKNVAEASAAAKSQIAATSVYTLSAAQQKALTDLIPDAEAKFAAQLADADLAVQALKDVGARAAALQRDLRAMARRINAVDLVPAGSSKAEQKVLAALHKAASDALAEVEP